MKKTERAARRQLIIKSYCEDSLTITQIAAAIGVTRQAVYAQLSAAGISTRPRNQRRSARSFGLKDLHSLYVIRELPVHKIAAILKTGPDLIKRELKRHNIELRAWNYRQLRASEINELKIGDSCIVAKSPSRSAYTCYYAKAKIRGMKISIRRIDGKHFEVTRIE